MAASIDFYGRRGRRGRPQWVEAVWKRGRQVAARGRVEFSRDAMGHTDCGVKRADVYRFALCLHEGNQHLRAEDL